ncbi:MAG: carbamoyltransferase HypF [Oceanospirillaceae bacterium]|nr:carbamoyltransferase HypF [Oceanospirillaceae bacterium]MBT13616.1 carbamoyltransferase HypF [Oceanospirillaceae bacterium]|tara:strand:+ start:16628 stop:19183 length:2556 start_codon:yes stop_codon:yes gene_type:complete
MQEVVADQVADNEPCGWIIRVQGIVQGVGFRPAVYRLATSMQLPGDVCNFGNRVDIRLYGLRKQVSGFCQALQQHKPPRAQITGIKTDILHHYQASEFTIRESEAAATLTASGVISDLAPCADCLAELFDPQSRRYGHPFINCTQCGPRFTLLKKLPYDRAHTSMAEFPLCAACAQEYEDPAERRFHAQPNACHDCGPRIWLEQNGTRHNADDSAGVIDQALAVIRSGGILALKSVGGFHLICDATNPDAIARLRARKQRPAKPLAIMLANTESARNWVTLTCAGQHSLRQPSAPIVLQTIRQNTTPELSAVLAQLAPGLNALGIMLPQSPLHWLLFHAAAGRPAGTGWMHQQQPTALVMTSGNASGSPLLTDNAEAREQLAGIADALLMHDRDIVNRCDDTVVDARDDKPLPAPDTEAAMPALPPLINRIGRGLAPVSFTLTACDPQSELPAVMATGGYLKNTLAVNSGAQLYVSQHIGDLDNPGNARQQQTTARQLNQLLQISPAIIACDLHPEGSARRLSERSAEHYGALLNPVPHHIAHIAAVMAEQPQTTENGKPRPTLGLALDGFGLGWDDAARGGELVLLSAPDFLHFGSFSALPLPGGDMAAREPWRMAISLLYAYGDEPQMQLWLAQQAAQQDKTRIVCEQLDKNINCPLTTSAGRWFDAIAGLLGVCRIQTYEGEAAMRLEALAQSALTAEGEPGIRLAADDRLCRSELYKGKRRLNMRLLARRIITASLEGADPARLALLFHQQLAAGLSEWVSKVAQDYNLNAVVLSGGCAQNALLRHLLRLELQQHHIRLILPEKAPVNDGGLAAGQLAWTLLTHTADSAAKENIDGLPAAPSHTVEH